MTGKPDLRGLDGVKPPKDIADAVLQYRPKPKSKAAKKREAQKKKR